MDCFAGFPKHSVIITTINPPNEVMYALAKGAEAHNWLFIIVGDKKSPKNFSLNGAEYLSFESQLKSKYQIAKLLPTDHYARKNIGYLHAIQHGANVIVDTDDDTFPRDNFWKPKEELIEVSNILGSGWVNIYKAFFRDEIWPRGFPLSKILSQKIEIDKKIYKDKCCIQQFLVDGNTDVDAIYRLINGREVKFDHRVPIKLSSTQRCPFNSQNTVWWPDARLFLYLPSFCSFRMTDIWRSFISQSYLLRNKFSISFHSPTVVQNRNKHDLINDFADEVPGYLNNEIIMKKLDAIPANIGPAEFLRKSYASLIEEGYIDNKEKDLVEAWIKDLSLVGGKEY